VAGGVYQLESSGGIAAASCCSPILFENVGLIHKVSGTNDSVISAPLSNVDGSIQVDVGRLILANNGSSSGATVTVSSGATLDLTGAASPTWTGRLRGLGGGRVELNNGQIIASGLILDMAPGLFQWTGGTLNGTATNKNEINLMGGVLSGQLVNSGLMRQIGSTAFVLNAGPGASVLNAADGVFDFVGDGSVNGASCCSAVSFHNAGLIRKSAGTSSSITVAFDNQNGSIQVDRGTLSIGNSAFNQGTGSLTVQLAGTNSSGQFAAGNVTLGGPLHVKLANGFIPQIGAEFQIVACSVLNGTFSALDVPAGISVRYAGNGVFLNVTGQVTGDTVHAASSQPQLGISAVGSGSVQLEWISGVGLILESAASLDRTANWRELENYFSTDAADRVRVLLPVTNSIQFFRLKVR
jgi:hypothetical protein